MAPALCEFKSRYTESPVTTISSAKCAGHLGSRGWAARHHPRFQHDATNLRRLPRSMLLPERHTWQSRWSKSDRDSLASTVPLVHGWTEWHIPFS